MDDKTKLTLLSIVDDGLLGELEKKVEALEDPLDAAQTAELLRILDALQADIEVSLKKDCGEWMRIYVIKVRILEHHANTCIIDNVTPDIVARVSTEFGHA